MMIKLVHYIKSMIWVLVCGERDVVCSRKQLIDFGGGGGGETTAGSTFYTDKAF